MSFVCRRSGVVSDLTHAQSGESVLEILVVIAIPPQLRLSIIEPLCATKGLKRFSERIDEVLVSNAASLDLAVRFVIHNLLESSVHGRSRLDDALEEPKDSTWDWLNMLRNELRHVNDLRNRTTSCRIDCHGDLRLGIRHRSNDPIRSVDDPIQELAGIFLVCLVEVATCHCDSGTAVEKNQLLM